MKSAYNTEILAVERLNLTFQTYSFRTFINIDFLMRTQQLRSIIVLNFVSNKRLCSLLTQLSATMKRTCLDLDKKIAILDYPAQHPKLRSRKSVKHFSIGMKAVANILKQGINLRKNFNFFKGIFKSVAMEIITS